MEQVRDNKRLEKKLTTYRKDVTDIVLRRPIFDTKNYYFYYTEIRKERP